MFATFRRHQKWIWICAVIVVIPSFVIFLGPTGDQPGSVVDASGPYTIEGKPVTVDGEPITVTQLADALKETRLALFVRSGGREWPQVDERLNNEAIYRVFLTRKLAEMKVEVSEAATAQMARNRLGNYPYDRFKIDVLAPNNLTGSDFERYVKNEAAIYQLVNSAALNSKLVTPAEAEFVYRQENEEVSASVVAFFQSNYLSQVTVTDPLLLEHYTNSRALYRIPARVQLRYVEFPATNFLAEAQTKMDAITNLSERIDQFYFERGPDNFKDTNSVNLTAEAAKARIRDEMRQDLALNLAHQKANQFGSKLMQDQNPNNTNTFVQLANVDNLEIKITPPFDSLEGLEDSGLPEEIAQIGANLTAVSPNVFEPIRGTNAVYVISWRNTVPFRLQPYEEVTEKVKEDYLNREAIKLAYSAGTNFYTFLTNGLAAGKTFADLAREQNVPLIDLPPFSPATQTLTNVDERIRLGQLRNLVFQNLEPGQASEFTRTPEGGLVLFLNKRLEFDPEKLKAEVPETKERLQQIRQTEAFNAWFGKAAQQSLVIPQRTPPPQTGAPANLGAGMPGTPGQ